MTGEEHYQAAEEALEMAGNFSTDSAMYVAHVARAQVHATLAVAAIPADRDARVWRALQRNRAGRSS